MNTLPLTYRPLVGAFQRPFVLVLAIFLGDNWASAAAPSGYELAWADEFEGTTLDESQWLYRADEKHQSIQLPGNVEVEDGSLVLNLTPLDTPINGFDAAGAGVITRQRFRYGYYEVRARFGDGIDDDNDGKIDEGWWHAFWAMQADETEEGTVTTTFTPSRRTEIDAVENASSNLSRFTQHVLAWNQAGQVYASLPSSDDSQIPTDTIYQWHTYAFQWTPDEVQFYVDDVFQHAANYPVSVYEHQDINVWLTAISHNSQDSHQERSEARYDYFRYYTPGDIQVLAGQHFSIGREQEIETATQGSLLASNLETSASAQGSVAGNVIAQSASTVSGAGVLYGSLLAESGSTIRIGGNGLFVPSMLDSTATMEDFEHHTPGVAFKNGSPTALTPNWQYYDLGTNGNDAQFVVSGRDGTPAEAIESSLTNESQMLFQRVPSIDYKTENVGGEPFAGAVAIAAHLDASGAVDIIDADFALDGYGDNSGVNLDSKLVFGFRDIDNWFALSIVAGDEVGASTQVSVTANIDGKREDVFKASGSSDFLSGFPEDTILHAQVVHDAQLGYVRFSISEANTQTVLIQSFAIDDRFKEDGLIGFAVNNDVTGYDNFRVETLNSLPALGRTTLEIEENYTQQANSTLEVDIASSQVFDQLLVAGDVHLSGTLVATANATEMLSVGDEIPLILADGTIEGSFDSVVFHAGEGLALQLEYGEHQVLAEVVLAGDYNRDGVVNLADYVVWRNSLGAMDRAGRLNDHSGDGVIGLEEHDLWKHYYENTAASVALNLEDVAVPEPSLFGILVCPGLILLVARLRYDRAPR